MSNKTRILTLFLCISFAYTLNAQPIRINLQDPIGDDFIGSELFRGVSFVPLTVEKANMITHDMELKFVQNQYFVLDNRFLRCVYRFDNEGNFLNTIGGEPAARAQRANQPALTNPINFSIDPYQKHVEIYNFEDSEIRRYQYSGDRIDKINVGVNPADFIRERSGNYWFYMGWNNTDTQYRLLKANRSGKIINQEKRLITNCTSTEGYAFYDSKNFICHWELFGNVVYRINEIGIKESFQFNFGNYSLPLEFHQMDGFDSFKMISEKGYYTIKKYIENENFAYFFINFTGTYQRELIHVIYDKKNNKPHIYNELANIGAFDKAQALTDDDELVFLVAPRLMRRLLNQDNVYVPEIFNELKDQISDLRFPVALKIKLGTSEE